MKKQTRILLIFFMLGLLVGCSKKETSIGDNESATVTLKLEDDREIECDVIAIYPIGDREYIALLPMDEDGTNDENEVYLYRYSDVDGEQTFENIEGDDEYKAATDEFDKLEIQ